MLVLTAAMLACSAFLGLSCVIKDNAGLPILADWTDSWVPEDVRSFFEPF